MRNLLRTQYPRYFYENFIIIMDKIIIITIVIITIVTIMIVMIFIMMIMMRMICSYGHFHDNDDDDHHGQIGVIRNLGIQYPTSLLIIFLILYVEDTSLQ